MGSIKQDPIERVANIRVAFATINARPKRNRFFLGQEVFKTKTHQTWVSQICKILSDMGIFRAHNAKPITEQTIDPDDVEHIGYGNDTRVARYVLNEDPVQLEMWQRVLDLPDNALMRLTGQDPPRSLLLHITAGTPIPDACNEELAKYWHANVTRWNNRMKRMELAAEDAHAEEVRERDEKRILANATHDEGVMARRRARSQVQPVPTPTIQPSLVVEVEGDAAELASKMIATINKQDPQARKRILGIIRVYYEV